MAPHPPKFKAGDLLRHREGKQYLFIAEVKGLSYDLMMFSSFNSAGVTMTVRQTATAKIVDWAYELAT